MKSNSRILLDLDGCVVQYDFSAIVKQHFGVKLSSKSIFAYDLADVLGVSSQEINKMFEGQVFGKPCFKEGALETLREWQSKSWEIIIYSNRVKYMGYMGLAEWLIKWDIPFDGFDLDGSGSYNFHIDDSPGKLAATDSKVKLLFKQPWNTRCKDIKKQMVRVKSWGEINKIIGG